MIRLAITDDLNKIHSIAQSNSLNKRNKISSTVGFLVSNYSIDDYRDYVNNNNILVIEDDDNIKAFLLTLKGEELDREQIVHNEIIKYHKNANFILAKQICVDLNYKQKGYGSTLYKYMIEYNRVDIFANIVMEPINEASINFHKRMGFQKVLEIIPEDGIERHTYIRKYA